jgi:Cu/Zn superoxide dismutase
MRRDPEVVTAARRAVRRDRVAPRAGPSAASPARLALAALLALALAGCAAERETIAEQLPAVDSMEARMAPIGGSAVSGSVVFSPTSSGIAMKVYLTGLPMARYQIVIHGNGNCSSPNGFSAGPPLKLPGAAEHVMAGVPPRFPLRDDSLTLVLRIPGIQLEGPNGIAGKSVVVHSGADGSLDAQPGVPNNRVACGVIAPMQRLLF